MCSLVQPWFKYIVGNGHDIFLWLENWHPLGLYSRSLKLNSLIMLAGFLLAKVDTIIDQGVWRWPRSRSLITREIINHTPSFFVPITDQSDSVIWTLHPSGCFTSLSAWNGLEKKYTIDFNG